MTDPMQRAMGRGCLAQGAIALVAPAITLALFALAAIAAMFFPEGSTERLLAFAAALVVLMGGFGFAALAFAARRTRVLDPGFAQLGVPPHAVMFNVREYHGVFRGREVDATFTRRGPRLELYVGAQVYGALAVGTRTSMGSALAGVFNLPQIPMRDPAFSDLVVSSDDPSWATHVLAMPAVRDAVLRAVHDPAGREMRVFAVRPGAVKLARSFFDPDACAREVLAMTELLHALAGTLEQLPAPARPTPLSEMERRVRKGIGRSVVKVVFGVFGVLMVLAVGGSCLAMALLSRNHRQAMEGSSTGTFVAPPGYAPVYPQGYSR